MNGDSRTFGLPSEWQPWLALVTAALREADSPSWGEVVPVLVDPAQPNVPVMAGAAVCLERATVLHLLQQVRALLPAATPALAGVAAVFDREDQALALFDASLQDEAAIVDAVARACGTDIEAVSAVASLLPVGLLQACGRRFAGRLDANWSKGYCPLCGSWPAFAEVLGVERTRQFRCARCGAAWPAPVLSCAFCETTDHNELARLVPADEGQNGVIEACTRCSGYVKALTTLQASQPRDVMLRDLDTVHLDFAALEQGFVRPRGAGHPLHLRITVAG